MRSQAAHFDWCPFPVPTTAALRAAVSAMRKADSVSSSAATATAPATVAARHAPALVRLLSDAEATHSDASAAGLGRNISVVVLARLIAELRELQRSIHFQLTGNPLPAALREESEVFAALQAAAMGRAVLLIKA